MDLYSCSSGDSNEDRRDAAGQGARDSMTSLNRRDVLKRLGQGGAALLVAKTAHALGLPQDKTKTVHYYSNSGDASGRRGQPMVNQSTRVVVIETESGLRGIGEGGEPRTMEECAAMLVGLDPFRIDLHWQRMMRGMHYTAGREKLHSLGGLDLALWDLKGKALGVPVWQLLGGKSRATISSAIPQPFRFLKAARSKMQRAPAARQASASIDTPPTSTAVARWTASPWCAGCSTTA